MGEVVQNVVRLILMQVFWICLHQHLHRVGFNQVLHIYLHLSLLTPQQHEEIEESSLVLNVRQVPYGCSYDLLLQLFTVLLA